MNRKQREWLLAAPILLLSIGLLIWVDANIIVPLKPLTIPNSGNDFSVFWAGARTILQGGNPYLTGEGSVYRTIVVDFGGDLAFLEPYISPYYLTIFFMPLAILPLGLAATLWIFLNQVLLAAALVMLIRISGYKLSPTAVLLAVGLAMLWRYTFLVMIIGNLSLFLLFAFTAACYYNLNNRPYLAGGFAAILLVKPQLFFLVLPLLLIVPNKTGWWNEQTRKRWLGFGVVSLIFTLYSFVLLPDWIGSWLRGVAATGYSDAAALNSQVISLRSVVALLVVDASLVLPISLLIGGFLWLSFGWLCWQHRYSSADYPHLLAIGLALNLLTTPYIRDYDSCILLFALLFNYFTLRKRQVMWSWLFWPLALLPIALHFASSWATNAVETIIPISLIVITYLVWQKSAFGLPKKSV